MNATLKILLLFLFFFKVTLYTCSEEVEDVGSRMDEGELTKVQTQGIKKKKRSYGNWLRPMCWSSRADSVFFGLSKFVLKEIKKPQFVFGV